VSSLVTETDGCVFSIKTWSADRFFADVVPSPSLTCSVRDLDTRRVAATVSDTFTCSVRDLDIDLVTVSDTLTSSVSDLENAAAVVTVSDTLTSSVRNLSILATETN